MTLALLEVCVDSAAGLAHAVASRVDRLEVCAHLDVDGLTPTRELLAAAVASGIPCSAMVRPRAGDHVWSRAERPLLASDLTSVLGLGARSVVLGAITADGRVDSDLVAELVALARPAPVTFHRAFDLLADPAEGLEVLVRLGVARILTSGGARDAFEGRFRLRRLIEQARGRIAILPGGGIRAHNAGEILSVTGARELHSSTVFAVPATPA